MLTLLSFSWALEESGRGRPGAKSPSPVEREDVV